MCRKAVAATILIYIADCSGVNKLFDFYILRVGSHLICHSKPNTVALNRFYYLIGFQKRAIGL